MSRDQNSYVDYILMNDYILPHIEGYFMKSFHERGFWTGSDHNLIHVIGNIGLKSFVQPIPKQCGWFADIVSSSIFHRALKTRLENSVVAESQLSFEILTGMMFEASKMYSTNETQNGWKAT